MRIEIYKKVAKKAMTEEPKKPEPQPFMIDASKILPTIASMYKQFSWAIPMIEKYAGFKVPPEVIQALDGLASGKPLSAEDMQRFKTRVETMQPAIGEPVLTRHIARDAHELHYKNGLSFRDIAEKLTKEGYPCSYATVARYVEAIDAELRMSKVGKLIGIGRFFLMTVLPALIAFWIGKTLF